MPVEAKTKDPAIGARHTSRADMDTAIKAIVVPALRAMGFKGSMLRFHRPRGEAVDLLTFQFRSDGAAFVVELGRVAVGGFDFHGRHIPVAEARASYLKERHRLGSELRANYGDHWFAFADGEAAREVCAELERVEVWAFVDGMAVLGG